MLNLLHGCPERPKKRLGRPRNQELPKPNCNLEVRDSQRQRTFVESYSETNSEPDDANVTPHNIFCQHGLNPARVYEIGNLEARSSVDGKLLNNRNKRAIWNAFLGMAEVDAKFLRPGNPKELTDCIVSPETLRQRNEVFDRMVQRLAKLSMQMPRGSVERRICRALLCDVVSFEVLREKTKPYAHKENTNFSFEAYEKAKLELKTLDECKRLPVSTFSRRRFDPECVNSFLEFTLSRKYIYLLSWGRKVVRHNKSNFEIPVMVRKAPMSAMWDDYVSFIQDRRMVSVAVVSDSKKKRFNRPFVSKATFFSVLSKITSGNQKPISAIDTVAGTCIYDIFSTLYDIIKKCVNPAAQEKMNQLSLVAKNFLTVQYDRHVRIDKDLCATHSLDFALNLCDTQPRSDITCVACKFIYYFLDLLRTEAQWGIRSNEVYSETSVNSTIEFAKQNFRSYQAHRARVVNQQIAISCHEENIRRRSLQVSNIEEAIIVLDFKTKWLPKKYRETSQEFYGKKGVSWHCFGCKYFARYDDMNDEIDPVYLFCDQIQENDSTQDRVSVVCLLETFLLQLKKTLPSLKRIQIQSDNAKYYNNRFVKIATAVVAARIGLRIDSYIHTESSDGKSIVDAHFGAASRHVHRYMIHGHDVETPEQLIAALVSNKGIRGSWAQLVKVDREAFAKNAESVYKIAKIAVSWMPRFNEVQYDYSDIRSHCKSQNIATGSSHFRCFSIKAFKFSGSQNFTKIQFHFCGNYIAVKTSKDKSWKTFNEPKPDEESDSSDSSDSSDAIDSDSDYGYESPEPDETSDESSNEEDIFDMLLESSDNLNLWSGASITKSSVIVKSPEIPKWRVSKQKESQNETDSKDVLSYSLQMLDSYCADSSNTIVQVRDAQQDMPEYQLAKDFKLPAEDKMHVGWARIRKKPRMAIDFFLSDIEGFFREGENKSNKRMGAASMQQALKQKYPSRVDIPSVANIKKIVQKLLRDSKKQNTVGDSLDSETTKSLVDAAITEKVASAQQKKRMSRFYAEILERGVIQEEITPKNGYEYLKRMVQNHDEDDPDFPSIEQVKNKINNFRSTIKNKLDR